MEREDDALRLWRDLIAAAAKEPDMELPTTIGSAVKQPLPAERTTSEDSERIASRSMGVIQNLGGVTGGAVSSLLNTAVPAGGGANWLKWLNPIAGLMSLFTGRKQAEAQLAAPVMSPRPPKRSVEYGLVASEGGAFRTVDTDERGRVRLLGNEGADPRQVVIQVQAMDSRSFLDHRDEIASAVKQALMESHGLGTVLGEFQE